MDEKVVPAKCPGCGYEVPMAFKIWLAKSFTDMVFRSYACPNCGNHFRIVSRMNLKEEADEQ